jgi:4-diphosphocytidyl-2-C-methyl-D-erythritol kinase
MSRTVVLRPSAKINLTLRVGPIRADGFHEVRTLLQSLALSDTLAFTERRGPFALSTRSPGVPTDQSNLVWRAAALLWTSMGRAGAPRDAHVKLDKQIPVAAGLGGGSANAAAALAGLNQIWNARKTRRDLMKLGAELGADVPFFLQGGTALGTGRGDELYPVDDIAQFGVIVIKPSFGVSTADAYRWLDDDRAAGLSPEGAEPARRHEIEVGWPGGPVTPVNDLEGPVARRHPAVNQMIESCIREGALAAAMTGSGSAVYGVFPPTVARRALKNLQRPEWLVLLTRTANRREAARHMGGL